MNSCFRVNEMYKMMSITSINELNVLIKKNDTTEI